MFDALHPHIAPTFADDFGIGRQVIVGKHGRGPIEIILRKTPANPVNVRGVAVVSGAHGDDGLEGGRLARGNLQAIEAAPGDADHGHLAIAPALLCEPGNGFAAIKLFLNGVFVFDQSFAVAGAADIQAHAGVTVSCKIHMQALIPRAGAVAFAVGDIFENNGNGALFAVFRQPHLGRKLRSILQGNEDIFHGFDAAWKLCLNFRHPSIPILIELPYNKV